MLYMEMLSKEKLSAQFFYSSLEHCGSNIVLLLLPFAIHLAIDNRFAVSGRKLVNYLAREAKLDPQILHISLIQICLAGDRLECSKGSVAP